MVTFVAGDDCLSYIPQLVTKSESLTCSFPRSFLVTSLADLQLVLITTSYYARSGLSACICFGPGLCLQVAIAFSCPLGALLALFYERGAVLLREVIAAARAARPQVGSLRAHNVRSVSPLSHSTVTGRLPLSLISHLGLQFGVFLILP